MAGKSPDEVQRAVEIYQQELTKLQQKMAAAAKQEEADEVKKPLGLPPPPVSSKPEDTRPLGTSPAVLAPPPMPPAAPPAPPAGGAGDASPLQVREKPKCFIGSLIPSQSCLHALGAVVIIKI